ACALPILPVRMVQGDPDLHAPVLEAEHLRGGRIGGEVGGAVGERLQHRAYPGGWQRGERAVVLVGEADHLAAPGAGRQWRVRGGGRRGLGHAAGGEGGEPVLEDHHVVVGGRYLGVPALPGRAQWTFVGRGEEGALLPVRRHRYPLV